MENTKIEELILDLGDRQAEGIFTWQEAADKFFKATNENISKDALSKRYYRLRDKRKEQKKEESKNNRKKTLAVIGAVVIFASGWVASNKHSLQRDNKYADNDLVAPPAIEDEELDVDPVEDIESIIDELLEADQLHFDINSEEEVAEVIVQLSTMINASSIHISNHDLLALTLVANGKTPDELNIRENLLNTMDAILNIDLAEAVNAYAGVSQVSNERTPLNLEIMFSNRLDRAYVKSFMEKREAILDAIFEGKNPEELIETFYRMQCALINRDIVNTTEGEIEYQSVGTFARFLTLNMLLRTNAIIGGKNPNYSLEYKELNYPFERVINELQEMSREQGENLAKELECSGTQKTIQ